MQPNYCIRKMNLKLPADVWGEIGGSDNGLICLTIRTKYNGIPAIGTTHSPNEPLYVCNPMTREFVNLPRILIDEKESNDGIHIVYGFGYHPIINKYKVVRIFYVGNPKNPTFKGHVQVYTLGSGSGWQSTGETDYYLWPEKYNVGDPVGVCVNGALHWPCAESADIVAFDLADEEFHLLPTPSTQIGLRRLFVNRRCLCLEYFNLTSSLELWFLKKDNSSIYNGKEQYYKSWSWNRGELRVAPPVSQFLRWPVTSHTKSGEILLTNGREYQD
ncbi:hypothetical protein MKX03_023575 [Papaver bracteatum]|nr:hypothetical protein MKX03_023575 [Papaver bracteatum]